ncbi:GyrI-like domain-containing protein [Paenibacillus sp. NPDC058071]|uniref:AraC family transcriptional regulator n=1 Tax=Paenibacillus sp. NPDC058071 TaxID=3346326 RepID=UPI0036D81304
MNRTVEMLPSYRVAYVRQVGPYGPVNRQAMETLKQWAGERNKLSESAILLGIPQDNPQTTLPENCRYDACIVISGDEPADAPCSEGQFSGGEYMVFEIKHTAEDMERAWADIFPALHSSGYQMDNKPIVERYRGKALIEGYCEICVPIKRL